MEKVTVSVAELYLTATYYGFMPLPLFRALEAAYLNGQPLAQVDKGQLSEMFSAYTAFQQRLVSPAPLKG